MMAELSYNLHFLCNSNPTPLDLWRIWRRSGTSRGDPTRWGFDLSKVVPVLLCARWRAMHIRGLELCSPSLGTYGRGDSRFLSHIYEGIGDEIWCSACTARTRAKYTGNIESVHGIHDEVPYAACSPECEAKFKAQFEKMATEVKDLQATEQGAFQTFVQWVSAATTTIQNTVHTCNSVQSGEISLLPRGWAGKPINTHKVGHRKTFETVIPYAFLRTTTPDELFQISGLVHRICNNVHLGAATTNQYKSLHRVQLSAHTDASTWRPIRDRLPLYLGYGVPFTHMFSPVVDAVVLGQYPDVRYGMHRSQIACAQGRDNTQETGLKPKCVPMLLQNMRDPDIEVIRTSLSDDSTQHVVGDSTSTIRLGQSAQEAIHQARMIGAWNHVVWQTCYNNDIRSNGDPDEDPDRILISSIRSMCLAAQSCILAYFTAAYALAGKDVALQSDPSHTVHEQHNHLRAGPGATGDPDTRPDIPLGYYRFERGYLIGFEDDSSGEPIKWAICEKVKFGPRPIRVRVLGSHEVTRIPIHNIRYVQRRISSQYAQCALVNVTSGYPDTASTGSPELRWRATIAAIILDIHPKVTWDFRAKEHAALTCSIWQWYWNTQSECMSTWWECPHGAVHLHGPRGSRRKKPQGFRHPRCTNSECIRTSRAAWRNHLRVDCGRPSPTLFTTTSLQQVEAQDHGQCHDQVHTVSYTGDAASIGTKGQTHTSRQTRRIQLIWENSVLFHSMSSCRRDGIIEQ